MVDATFMNEVWYTGGTSGGVTYTQLGVNERDLVDQLRTAQTNQGNMLALTKTAYVGLLDADYDISDSQFGTFYTSVISYDTSTIQN